MKTSLPLLFVLGWLALAAPGLHADKITPGPKGGRLLDTEPQAAEFFVRPDRKVEITFYDAGLKPVAPASQVVAVIAETPGGRKPLELAKTAEAFVSAAPLPAGEPYRVVVQVRATPDARPRNFRIDLNLDECGECNRPEYACTCEGH